ncbi:VacB/RNase II family 3'-5' exoribonuclease [filamentous cyanobacterium LEGE 11480]|uniref:VacB/RNase II family 3'-5' exoribonuclease n=1 Tax=Romeriopsis navalis LEGE 11480 TaxID=2777977 RepID=A0A928VVV8_9CYAN|nr:ribonuclease R family protein [Romeriopsis navalis]MBE9033009.1 VacB/RNase II family 3'-5' exoribonuclease [Romeriopsis navalis LEGE 11480]
MEKGTLVEFRVNGDRRLAVADRPEGKKNWIVIDARNQSHSLPPRSIHYEISGSYEVSKIEPFLADVAKFFDPSSLEVAWELLLEIGDGTNPQELANLLFSDQSAPASYAAYCMLDDDRLYFKRKGDRYEPRTPNQVAELKHQQEAGNKRQQEWEEFIAKLASALAGEEFDWVSSDRPRLDALEKFATFADEASNKTTAIDILSALGKSQTPQSAFDVLVQLKLWNPHENLLLRRSNVPVAFPQKVVELARKYMDDQPEDLNERLDLTHLKVYTIDDESTTEIDDGLSIEYLEGDRQKIWVHIADPTRWLTPGDALDLEARRRGTTLYLPTGMISMFPMDLAAGPMSLTAGQVCCALSFAILLDDAGGVEDFSIHATSIKTTYRLTYDDVDEMLDLGVRAEPEIHDLAKWAKLRKSWRKSQGAISIKMPESAVKVKDGGEDVDVYILEGSFARELVAEMMILSGEVAAKYGQIHELPMLFRAQQQPELPPEEELMVLPAGPVRFCAVRRCMPRSEVSLTPFRHASLGLEHYTQVTSPIRRYGDLLAHFQIKAHLRGAELPFPVSKMQEIILSLTPAVQDAVLLERQSNRYWILEYLRRNADQIWDSLMLRWLREHEGLALIMLEDLGVELVMRFDRPIELGERLLVQVAQVDPREDIIRLREVAESSVEALAS